MDKDGFLTYFDMWRAIKSLNLRSFVLDAREIENILIKILKMKDNREQLQEVKGLHLWED